MAYPKLPLTAEPMVRISRPRWPRWIGIFLVASITTLLGFVGVQAYRLSQSVFVANGGGQSAAFDLNAKASATDWNQFQQPGDGRANILVLGIGGINDSGVAHKGTYLTDSIQLISLDTVNHKVALVSLPRDLEVKNPNGYGYEKINSVYQSSDGTDKDGGSQIKATVSTVLGTRVTNYIVVDFTAAKKLVDAVGGIDVNVPAAINDQAYPAADELGFDPFIISAGPQHLNGTTALKYMRTRHDDSDFGRSGRQQAVLAAVQQKALSIGILGNPSKINQIVSALGSHVKTDLSIDEVGKLVTLLKSISTKDLTSNVLDTSEKLGLLISTSDPDLGYIQQPTNGVVSYEAIHNWYQLNTPDPLIVKEGAVIELRNAGTTSALFTAALTKLTSFGFKATATLTDDDSATASPSPKGLTQPTIHVRKQSADPVTVNYLKTILSGTVVTDSTMPSNIDILIDYVPARVAKTATSKSAPGSFPSADTASTPSAWTIR